MAEQAESVLEEWRAALLAGDVEALAEIYESDAVYYVPALGIAAKGRTAIAQQWHQTFAQWRAIEFEVLDQDLQVNGDLASSWLQARMTVEWHEDGRQEAIEIRAADVFHRGDDRRWRYAVDHA